MSSPVFGGKMTSTSGKTRQSDHNEAFGVTSNLLASTSRDNTNSIAVVDAAVASDGSVSPFEALDTFRWGADTVGGGRDVAMSVSDVCSGNSSNKNNGGQEAIPMIVLTHPTTQNNDAQQKKIDHSNNYNNDNGKDGKGNNSNTDNNSNNKRNNTGNQRHTVKPTGKSAYNRNKTNNSNISITRTSSSLSNKPNEKGVENKKKELGKKEEKKVDVKIVKKSDTISTGNRRNDNAIEHVEDEEERKPMLGLHSGGGGDAGGSGSGSLAGGGVGDGAYGVCSRCGQAYPDAESSKTSRCIKCSNDDDHDGDAVKEKQSYKKSRKFSCLMCNSKKVKSRNDTKVHMIEVKGDTDPSGQVRTGEVAQKGTVKVKTKVRFAETNVDEMETKVDTTEAKVETEKAKVETEETKVDKKKKVKDNSVSSCNTDHQYSRVLNMLVLVPHVHLIPEVRRYENYFVVKPEDDVEFGKKPKWIAPRLKHYLVGMGCGTSNQVVSNESKMPIVVFGATGVIGGSVVRALLKDHRFMVKAVTRTPTTDQARGLAEDGAVVVPADLNDVRSLQRVMEGAAGVFLTTNFWEHLSKQKELTHGMNAVDAAVSCNVRHFIFQGSEHTRDEDKPCGHLNAKAAIEEYVKETTLAFTSIHMPFLYENLLSLFKPHCVQHGTYTIPIPMSDNSIDCMSLHDLARCVVNIFLRPKNHMLKSVQLTGDRMTVQHMADVLSRHFDDRKFVYHKLNPDDFATFDFQGSQDLAAMFEFLQTAPHRDPRITRRIHHSVVCFDRWVADNKQKLHDAMKDTGEGSS